MALPRVRSLRVIPHLMNGARLRAIELRATRPSCCGGHADVVLAGDAAAVSRVDV